MSRTFRRVAFGWEQLGHRDKKKFLKPTSTFKRITKAKRKAKEKAALRNGQEPPKFRRSDQWDYL